MQDRADQPVDSSDTSPPGPPPLNRPIHLDGVRPRLTTCNKCGYEVSRVAINCGVIICPECANPITFELPTPDRSRIQRIQLISRFARIAFIVALLAITALLAWAARQR